MPACEPLTAGDGYRAAYLTGVRDLIASERIRADAARAQTAREILSDPDAARERFRRMLGWPLTMPRPASVPVTATPVDLGWDCDITRLTFEVFPGLPFYGILFRHRDDADRPFIISQHGGLGTPELCSGLPGYSGNYNSMTQRLLALGANVFAPQMLLWNMGQDEAGKNRIDDVRRGLDNDLKQLGGSITALELYCLQVAIDYFLGQDYVDPDRLAMAGLSYGGFYTQFAAAVDTRIRRALTCSQFNDRFAHSWSDWVWFDAAHSFLDAEVALLSFPRQLTICVGDEDALFRSGAAKAEYERLLSYLPEGQRDWVEFVEFAGVHEFIRDDAVLKRALFDGWM